MADEPDASGMLNNKSTQFKISVLWDCHKNPFGNIALHALKTLNIF